MHSRTRQDTGFTIMELLVAMTLLGLLLFLINTLFQDTARAVTTSAQTSKVLATARVINEQLDDDADKMVGPAASNGGYIIIFQQKLPTANSFLLNPVTLSQVNVTELRCDHMVFIRDANGLSSMTPQGGTGYRSNLVGQAGDRAKVWYGIAQRTNPDGSNTTHTLGAATAGLDRIGSNFILGRQALLFNPTDVSLATPTKMGIVLSSTPTAYTYTVNQFKGSPVRNTGYSSTPTSHKGLTDVTSKSYTAVYNEMVASGATNINFYLNTAYTDGGGTRLRVNPSPVATNYESWAVAQSHPILAQGCSEVIIDFAADLDGDGIVDNAFGGQSTNNSSQIWWYDALKQPSLGAVTGWTAQTSPAVLQPWVNINANTKAFVFRVDDDAAFGGTLGTAGSAHSYWPYPLRLRYRLHDNRGRLTSNNPAAVSDGLDNDGDGTTDEVGEDQISGRWFERIIRVPRP